MSEVFDIVTINDNILKEASPKAAKIIRENPLWFSHLYFIANDDDHPCNEYVWFRFWSRDIHDDRPNYWVPPKVLSELLEICRKDYERNHRPLQRNPE